MSSVGDHCAERWSLDDLSRSVTSGVDSAFRRMSGSEELRGSPRKSSN